MSESSDPDKVICDYWETPVLDSESLWLYRQLYTSNNNYFFFNKNTDRPEDPIYVLMIRGGTPSRFRKKEKACSGLAVF